MTNDELIAIRALMREELTSTENKIRKELREELTSTENRLMDCMEEQIKAAQADTMKGAAVLIDSQFIGQFNLLFEKMEEVLRKMPSDEDMDIIDETLQEHDSKIKILRKDVNDLQIAL